MATRCCSFLEMKGFTDTDGSSYGALYMAIHLCVIYLLQNLIG